MSEGHPLPPISLAEGLLMPILERLEHAQDLICRSNALQQFTVVAELCAEARHLAAAGAALRAQGSSD